MIGLAAVVLSIGAAVLGTPLSTSPVHSRQQPTLTLAPVIQPPPALAHTAINNSYIVILKPDLGVSPFAHLNLLQATSGSALFDDFTKGLRHVFDSHIKGYTGVFSEDTIERIRAQPEVDYIEQDQEVRVFDVKTQKGAPWGLARISHRKKLTLGTFNKYEYDADAGDGVDVYVIDTGINVKHVEFEGRASWGKTIPANAQDLDGNGHGTHCAGTIASRAYGVAKAAHVIAVKVLGDDGSGSMSDVVAGVVWASDAAAAKLAASRAEYAKTGKTAHKGSVANMSLGGGKSRALDDAVNGAVEAGIHFSVAAGNDNRDACDYSPAAAELAVTVGASTIADERAYFSNHGPCVDIFGPGLNILSTWIGSNISTNTISGTSMAAPHTAGLLAYLLSLYPSPKFAPFLEPDLSAPATSQSILSGVAQINSISSLAQSSLPTWLTSWFLKARDASPAAPAPAAPIPPTITPAQLKKALIALASKGALTDLPAKTVNLLIFNNATSF